VFGGAGRTFLVESYVPGLDERAAATLSSRLRKAIRQLDEGGVTTLQWGGSLALVDEETYIFIVGALGVDDVVQLSERAGFEHVHVVEALAIDMPTRQGR
jgi:hypothetical protein